MRTKSVSNYIECFKHQQQQQQRKLQLQVNYTQKKRCLVEFTQGYKCVEVNHDE